jgi:hypothetical protein
MKNIGKHLLIGIGFFGAGVFLEKHFQKKRHNKSTTYAGTLQIFQNDGKPELFLSLDVLPDTLEESADVIFKVHKIK